jgi:hypothetical protein
MILPIVFLILSFTQSRKHSTSHERDKLLNELQEKDVNLYREVVMHGSPCEEAIENYLKKGEF